MFAGEVAWTATLEVGEICYAATVIKARIVIDKARRSVIPRYAVCGRLIQVHQCTRLVELQRHQQIEMQNVNTETNMISINSKHVIDDCEEHSQYNNNRRLANFYNESINKNTFI